MLRRLVATIWILASGAAISGWAQSCTPSYDPVQGKLVCNTNHFNGNVSVGTTSATANTYSPPPNWFAAPYWSSWPSPRNNSNGAFGATFTVANPSVVNTLGRYMSGASYSHVINLWISTNTSTPISTCTVTTSSTADSWGFRYCTPSLTPTLMPGNTYALTSDEVSGQDNWSDNAAVTMQPNITILNAAYSLTASTYPSNASTAGHMYDRPAIQFTATLPTRVSSQGSTADENGTAFCAYNSSGACVFRVLNDGAVQFGMGINVSGTAHPALTYMGYGSGSSWLPWALYSDGSLRMNTFEQIIGTWDSTTGAPPSTFMYGCRADVTDCFAAVHSGGSNVDDWATYNTSGTKVWANIAALTTTADSTVASATTIAPTTQTVVVSGTTTISTITVPGGFLSGCLTLIPTGAWSTTTGGNIANAVTATANVPVLACYSQTESLWYMR